MLAAWALAGLTSAALAYDVAGDQAFRGDMDKTASRLTAMPRLPATPRPLRPCPCGCSPTTASLLTIRRERAASARSRCGLWLASDRRPIPAANGGMLRYPRDGAPAREVARSWK